MNSKSRNASSGTKPSSSIVKLRTSRSLSPSARYKDDDENVEATFWKSSSSEQSLSISDLLAAADRAKNSIPSKILFEPNEISRLAIDDKETSSTASLSISDVFSWSSPDDRAEREGDNGFTSLPESDIKSLSEILVEEVNEAKSAPPDRSSLPGTRPDLRNTAPRNRPRTMTARISRDKKVIIPDARAKPSTFQGSKPKWVEEHHRLTPSASNRSTDTTKEHQRVQMFSRAA